MDQKSAFTFSRPFSLPLRLYNLNPINYILARYPQVDKHDGRLLSWVDGSHGERRPVFPRDGMLGTLVYYIYRSSSLSLGFSTRALTLGSSEFFLRQGMTVTGEQVCSFHATR